MGDSKKKMSELKELASDDLDKVFGGNSESTYLPSSDKFEDVERTIPTDPSKRKKKRLNSL